MKTFDDLVFEKHAMAIEMESFTDRYSNATHAKLSFDNGYGVSVIFGDPFYSNGIDSYELAVLKDGDVCYNTPITDDVLGYLSKDEVTEVMKNIQGL